MTWYGQVIETEAGMTTLYEVLGVVPSATLAELRSAFRRRALMVHPDKGGSSEEFRRVMFAFETLTDPSRRKRYDRKVVQQEKHVDDASEDEGCRDDRVETGCGNMRKRKSPAQRPKPEACHAQPKAPRCEKVAPERRKVGLQADLAALFHFLRRLPPSWRRKVLAERFSQSERLALERWGKDNSNVFLDV